MLSKNRSLVGFFGLLVLLLFAYWFHGKFFPVQKGAWANGQPADFSEEKVPNFGFRDNQFWVSVDYPGQQNVCLTVDLKSNRSDNQNLPAIVIQSPRAAAYPLAGTLATLFQEQSPATVTENINQDKPYLLNHLAENIVREGKDLFFVGEGEKFLIPTKNIFVAYFPALDLPPSSEQKGLTYSNKLITFPEGALLSDGKGVFVISNHKLSLIRSPEIFESLGYKWEEVRQMSKADLTFNPYLSGNLVGFDTAHPNGTILKNSNNFFLVWNEQLYSLSEEEKLKYFPGVPTIETTSRELKPSCKITDNEQIVCCVDNFDPRLNAPQNFPFANTLNWRLGEAITQEKISQVTWQAKIIVNKENTLHRLKSLVNFVLYTSGIVK